jgi:flagellar biosynthesis/type III secretory pathway chaperone
MMAALEQVTLLMTVMRQLSDVMDQERQVLRSMRLETLRDLQAEKAALADAYEVEMQRLRTRPEVTGELAPPVREELQQALRDFQGSLAANVAALQAAQGVLEKLMRLIGHSLADAAAPRGGYGPAGESAQVIPVAFNRHI